MSRVSIRTRSGRRRHLLQVFEERVVARKRRGVPPDLQRCGRVDRLPFLLRNDGDEVLLDDDLDHAWRRLALPAVDAGERRVERRRPNHARVHEPRNAHVLRVDEPSGRLPDDVRARHRLADDLVLVERLRCRFAGDLEIEPLVADQLRVGDRRSAAALDRDDALCDLELRNGRVELLRRHRQQREAGLRGCLSDRAGRCVLGFVRLAAGREPLVDALPGVTLDDGDLRQRYVELVRDELRGRRHHSGAELDLAGEDRNRAVAADCEPRVDLRGVDERRPDGEVLERAKCRLWFEQPGRADCDKHRAGPAEEGAAAVTAGLRDGLRHRHRPLTPWPSPRP